MTQSELSQLIAALRAETQQNAVSPNSLGTILEKMVERIEQALAISSYEQSESFIQKADENLLNFAY